jgi:hypothetical protein
MRDFRLGCVGEEKKKDEGGNFHPDSFPRDFPQDNDKNKLENLALLMQFQRIKKFEPALPEFIISSTVRMSDVCVMICAVMRHRRICEEFKTPIHSRLLVSPCQNY